MCYRAKYGQQWYGSIIAVDDQLQNKVIHPQQRAAAAGRHQECSSSIHSSIRRNKMQVLLKSSKQKAFETVRINNTTILFLKKQEKVAVQTRAKGESSHFSNFVSRISSHCPHLSDFSWELDVLPQVHVLKPSGMTWAPDHKPHTTGVCLHWPNLLSVWRKSVKTTFMERENKTMHKYISHYCFKNVFSNTKSCGDAMGCSSCCPEC